MFQINSQSISVDADKLPEVHAEFAAKHSVLIKQVIEPNLLAKLLKLLENAAVVEHEPGKEQGRTVAKLLNVTRDMPITQAFKMMFNRPDIFRLFEQITDCPPIEYFHGRIYMMNPAAGHFDTWHNDCDGKRHIGMSLNLTEQLYSGGVFQIKKRRTEPLLNEIANTGLGDLHLFRISEDLCHRVTQVEGTVTKVAFAGWFFDELVGERMDNQINQE